LPARFDLSWVLDQVRTALIAGATGLVGSACLQKLLSGDDYTRVISMVRRPLAAHPKLDSQIIDFERVQTLDVTPIDDFFCALGTTIKKAGSQEAFRKVDLEYPKMLAQYAKRCGARRIAIVSSVGADPAASNFYLRVKGEMEAAIESFGFDSTNIFRPSFLVGNRPEQRIGERIAIPLAKALQFALIGGLRRYRSIHADAVAAAMVASAKAGKPGTHVYHFDQIKSLAG
jgi:uncharacterized protein YbjT (DUF2867 family)